MSQTSSTLTEAARAARLRAVGYPSDYDLHHSETSVENDTHVEMINIPTNTSGNPPEWPNNYRRVPVYRPVNRNLDQAERRVYTSTAERIFLTVMFTGVRTNAAMNEFWRHTGEKLNHDWFKYKIGGEF